LPGWRSASFPCPPMISLSVKLEFIMFVRLYDGLDYERGTKGNPSGKEHDWAASSKIKSKK
jgi:hypothetical protein